MARIASFFIAILFLQLSYAIDISYIQKIGSMSATDVGNGGDIVVCDEPTGKTYEVLDITEGRELHKLGSPYQWPQGADEYEVAQLMLNRLQRVSRHRWHRLTDWLNKFKDESDIQPRSLVDISDEGFTWLDDNCEIKQIARQEPPTPGLGGVWYRINKKLWDNLDINNKAALILHEVMYREAIQVYGHETSSATRAAVAQLADDHYKELTDEVLFAQLSALDYPEFEFNNILFTLPDNTGMWSPSWDDEGSVSSVSCQVDGVSLKSNCFLTRSGALSPVYGFSLDHFYQGLPEENPFDDQVNYSIQFGETGVAKNIGYLEKKKLNFSFADFRVVAALTVDESSFVRKDEQGRLMQIKGNIAIRNHSGDNLYSTEITNKWRKRMDVRFFYLGTETFIGLAGGRLHEGQDSIELAGFDKNVIEDLDIGDYPTLIHIEDGLWKAIRIKTGSPFNLAKLRFEIEEKTIFKDTSVGGVESKKLWLENVGDGDVQNLTMQASDPFQFGSSLSGSDHCGKVVKSKERCFITVSFRPSSTGFYSSEILASYYDGVETQSLYHELEGRGVLGARLTFSELSPYSFGPIAVGGESSQTFTIENKGQATATGMTIGDLKVPFTFMSGSDCYDILLPGEDCRVYVSFKPEFLGENRDTIRFDYNNGVSDQTITREIRGTGAAPALITITETNPYDFGSVTVGGSLSHTFTLNNTGAVPAEAVREGSRLLAPFRFLGGSYPGTGGTCGNSLGAGASCDIVVAFSPPSTGFFSGRVDIYYNNGVTGTTSFRDLTGVGITSAILTLSESDPYDFGLVATGGNLTHTFTVTNTGATSATAISELGLRAPFGFLGGGFPGTGGDCGATIGASGSCHIVIEFSPASLGAFSDTIEIRYNDGTAEQSVTRGIQGTSGAPALLDIAGSNPYDFGTVPVGSSQSTTLTVINNGSVSASSIVGSLRLGTSYEFNGGTYPGTAGDCGATLSSGGSCILDIQYAPSTTGVHNGALTFDYDNGAAPVISSHGLVGKASSPAFLTITESDPYDFRNVVIGSSSNFIFTLSNSGGSAARSIQEIGLSGPFSFVGGSFPGTAGNCRTTLAAGSSCDLDISYIPSGPGIHIDSLDISYFDGTAMQTSSRDLQGTGVSPGVVTISGGPVYDYGTSAVGNVRNYTFVISNSGGALVTSMGGSGLVSPFEFKGGSYPGTGGTCTATIAAGGDCTIVVSYSPKSVSASDNDTIEIHYNDGVANQTASRGVTGSAVAPSVLTISEMDPYNYGTRATGSVTIHTFTVTNTGGTSATEIVGAGLTAPYRFAGGAFPGAGGTCTASLASGANCMVIVEYAPVVSSAADSDSIAIHYFDGSSAQEVTRDIVGSATTPASLTISDGPGYNFGSIPVGESLPHTFTITNRGGFAATTMAEVGLAQPFQFLGGAYPGTGGTCASTLAPASRCDIVLEFAPAGTGFYGDTMSISYNNGVSSVTAERDVQGTGVARPVPLAPTSHTLLSPSSSPNSDATPEIEVSGGGVRNGVVVNLYKDKLCIQSVGAVV